MSARQTRNIIGYSLEKCAVLAGVSSGTLRVYEANRGAVSPTSREKLDKFFSVLASMHAAERAGLNT